jgi:hypothetical protein
VVLNKVQHSARLVNISVAGARLRMQERVATGDSGTLILGAGGPETGAAFQVRTVHSDGSVGVAFDEATVSQGFAQAVELLTGAGANRAA